MTMVWLAAAGLIWLGAVDSDAAPNDERSRGEIVNYADISGRDGRHLFDGGRPGSGNPSAVSADKKAAAASPRVAPPSQRSLLIGSGLMIAQPPAHSSRREAEIERLREEISRLDAWRNNSFWFMAGGAVLCAGSAVVAWLGAPLPLALLLCAPITIVANKFRYSGTDILVLKAKLRKLEREDAGDVPVDPSRQGEK